MSKVEGLSIDIDNWSSKNCDNFRSAMFNECEKYNMILNQKQRKILMDNKELKKFASNQAKCILKLGKKSSGGKRNTRSKKNRSTKKRKTRRNNRGGGYGTMVGLAIFAPIAATTLVGVCVIGMVGYCAVSACLPTRNPTRETDEQEFRRFLARHREQRQEHEQAIRDRDSINNMPE